MSTFSSLFNTITSGKAHKLAQIGPFSQQGLREISVTDQNSSKEKDIQAVRYLTDRKYDSKSIIKKNEVYEISEISGSKSYNMLSSLGRITDNLKVLNDKYNLAVSSAEKEKYKNEITALTEQYNSTVNSEHFKKLNEISKSLAARKYIDGRSAGLQKSLAENSGLLGGNYITQATLSNSEYFKNLTQSLDSLSAIRLSAEFKDGSFILSAGNESGINGAGNEDILASVNRRNDQAMSSYLRGSALDGFLEKSIEDFRKLDSITEAKEGKVMDLGSEMRTQILTNPQKGLAAQAFLSPFIALSTLT